MSFESFENLDVWKRSSRLALDILKLTRSWEGDFALRDQLNRSAISIPSNIAEGYDRASGPDTLRFLKIAQGSSAELRTQLYLAKGLGLIESSHLIEKAKESSAMLQSLIQYRQRRIQEEPEP
ncbi:MAG: four helix bundle protein [Verrucomicrobiota bacterium]